MKRVKTGIKGFDGLIEGGIPEGSVILVSGTPGTGKTILGMQYLHNGVKDYKENGLYVSFEERKENLYRQAASFGWDIKKLELNGDMVINCISTNALEKSTPDNIVKIIKEKGIKRVVIDSLSTLTMNTPTLTDYPHTLDALTVKRFIYSFIQKLANTDATILLVSHSHDENKLSIDGVSEFICDGIVKINSQNLGGDHSRVMNISKMRSTKNDEDIHPVEIGKNGIVVHRLR
jgi:circadian clock protein KaiC